MTTTTTNTIETFITKPKEDLVTLLFALHNDKFESKAKARTFVEAYYKEHDIIATKPKTKKDMLQDWFMAQDNQLDLTKKQLKDACISFDMHGGSIDWYATAYLLAIDLHKKLSK